MTDAARWLLRDCVAAGVGLVAIDDRLRVTWAAGEDPAIRQRLRALKSELVAALGEPPTGPEDPRWAVELLADVDRWRAWMLEVRRVLGADVAPDGSVGWACYLAVRDAGGAWE